jgi:short subunit dehydrogenase-like uncharacterized protein
VFRRTTSLAALALGGATMAAWAQLPPTRNLLLKLRRAGDGPSAEQRARSWFEVRLRAVGGGRRVVTRVSGGDPGYGETSKMLAEAALCLAHDDLPERVGQLTPAVAMGWPLIQRLMAAGIGFTVTEEE